MAERKSHNLYIAVDECAEALGMSVSTIRRRIRSGDIPVIQFSKGSAIRISREFVSKLTQSPAMQAQPISHEPKLPGRTPRFLKEVS